MFFREWDLSLIHILYLIPGIPFFMFANAMNSVIRADGSPQFAMFSTLIGCALNVVQMCIRDRY